MFHSSSIRRQLPYLEDSPSPKEVEKAITDGEIRVPLSNCKGNIPLSNFLEWLRGFTDGEGCFSVASNNVQNFRFQFLISLHVDDLPLLELIQDKLKLGKVIVNKSRNSAVFAVSKFDEIGQIIDIFTRSPLNSTKHLNFLLFKKAYLLYTTANPRSEVTEEINQIIKELNYNRSDFTMGESHKIRITPNWLLGFVEGEGSFPVIKTSKENYRMNFVISQSAKDLALMEAIQKFLNLLSVKNPEAEAEAEASVTAGDVAKLHISKTPPSFPFDSVAVSINQSLYISNVLIPFLDSLTWFSKKELDYKDWKLVLKFKELGLHYTDEGVEVLNLIIGGINSKRLSTFKGNLNKNAEGEINLANRIEKLLSGPSNFEVKADGRIFIKSLNKYYSARKKITVEVRDDQGLLIETFDSIASCASFLGCSRMLVMNRLKDQKPAVIGDKIFNIIKQGEE